MGLDGHGVSRSKTKQLERAEGKIVEEEEEDDDANGYDQEEPEDDDEDEDCK